MKKSLFFRIALLPCLLLLGACLVSAEDISKIHPSGYVTDLAGVIATNTRAQLEALCTEVEQKTGAQMAIVTVNSLDDRSVEDYAVDLYKQLGVGGKKDNRGVLLLVAPHERKYRIEVGYGLEPVINDARAGDAGRAMVPFLRQGDYSKATEAAAWQLANYIAGDAGVTLSGRPPMTQNRNAGGHGGFPTVWILLGVFILFRAISSLSTGGRRGGGAGGSGCLWFLLGMMAGGGPGGRSGGSWGGGGGFGGGGGGGFGGFGGGSSGGGGASGSW